jgi:hypothetical protein
MPHVPGTSIAARVAHDGPLPADQVLQWLWPLAQGLQAIHDLGLVHRDIKPENVLIDERERPVLIDFGNATVLDTAGTVKHNFFAVSRCFAAPEQYVNDLSRTGPWTDIYALGALMYFCLSGQRPTDSAVRAAGGELPTLDSLAPGLPAAAAARRGPRDGDGPGPAPGRVPELLALLEPLRPQAFNWTQALPANPFGQRMHRVHEQVGQGIDLPRNVNLLAGLLQGFWFFAHRLVWPGVAASLFVLAGVGIGLWWRVLPITGPLAWLLAAVPCAWFADVAAVPPRGHAGCQPHGHQRTADAAGAAAGGRGGRAACRRHAAGLCARAAGPADVGRRQRLRGRRALPRAPGRGAGRPACARGRLRGRPPGAAADAAGRGRELRAQQRGAQPGTEGRRDRAGAGRQGRRRPPRALAAGPDRRAGSARRATCRRSTRRRVADRPGIDPTAAGRFGVGHISAAAATTARRPGRAAAGASRGRTRRSGRGSPTRCTAPTGRRAPRSRWCGR